MCNHCHEHNHCPCEPEAQVTTAALTEEQTTPLWAAWREWLPMLISALLLAAGIVLPQWEACPWLLFLVAYLPVGLPVIKEAWEELREGEIFSEFTLMIIATVGAFAIGEYPEAVAVMLFYSVGEYFQDRAVGRARHDIRALVNLRPDEAVVIASDGSRQSRSPEAVSVGDTIEVMAGGRVPLDGRLLTKAADFDTAALTGESEPRPAVKGDEIQAGTIALGRTVTLEVVRPYGESALQRILDMVEDASRRKSPAEKFIRRFARIYTPIVIALAALIALLPPLVTGTGWSEWLYRALVFLVISCPCALVVSVPLSYYRGIGVASRLGVLFKGGNYLDAITRIRTVVFDKTGTLTSGRFGVVDVTTQQGVSAHDLLALSAALERYSTHPVARAIVAAADNLPGGAAQASATLEAPEEISGLGLSGHVAGKDVLVGKRRLLEDRGIALPAEFKEDSAYTYVYCAVDGHYVGAIALRDEPKADARKAVSRLHAMGIRRVCMLSGDRTPVVEALAAELGIDQARGDLMPADKVACLQAIRAGDADKGGVAFVGDGVNDAPVLALSDVGIAMGGAGADAAVETADVVIQGDKPSRVADALRIGRHTRALVGWNISLALGVKVVVLILGALGMVGLWAAVLADTGVALLCVLNTYFIRK